jgi:predicted ATPase/DNA-binding winged helix-turn-helix (wHTH) protein
MPMAYRFGAFELHPAAHLLLRDGQRVFLTARALDVLILLVESRDRVISRDEIFHRLWHGTVVEDNNLSQQISRIRRVLGPFGDRQSWIATVPGRGFQFVGPVSEDVRALLPHPAASPRITPASPWPVMPDSILGRDRDLTCINELLARHAIVTLTGPGGVGKTRLAVEVAHPWRATGDGAYWIDLTRAGRPDEVLPLVAEAIGLADTGVRSLGTRVQEWLHDRRTLLVFDNFEHVLTAAPLLLELRAAGTAAVMLVTSRSPLLVRGEYEYPIGPLRWNADASPAGEASLVDSPAVRLFFDRFRAHGHPVQHAVNPAEVSALCERVDGLPLAIELVAARASLIPVRDLLKRDRIIDLLPEGTRDAPARQQSLQRTLEWSYELLPPPARNALRTLAVFNGGFTTGAAIGVLLATRVAPDEIAALDLIATLRQHSLLSFTGDRGTVIRMRMLETVREFSLGLAPPDENAIARTAHAIWFQHMFEREASEIRSSRAAGSMERLLAEHGNLRSALRWTAESGPAATLVDLATAASWFWHTANLFAEGREWTWLAVEKSRAAGDVSEQARCRVLAASALMSFHLGRFHETEDLLKDLSACPADRCAATLGQCLRAAILAYDDRLPEADALSQHALREAVALQDSWLQGLAALVGGHCASLRDDHLTAHDRLNGAPRGLGFLDLWVTLTLGLEKIMLERVSEAILCFRGALLQRYGSYVPIRQCAGAFEGLAYVCDRRGNHETAVLLLASADRWRRETAPLLKAWMAEHNRAVTSGRRSLGSRFDDVWLEGQSLTLDEAVAIAREVE